MRNGLTKTLAAVAMAWFGCQAFAVAPVVRDLPDAVVANDEVPVTGAAPFIYADFLDLTSPAVVSDDGPLTSLTWSYSSAGRYRFNGATSLNIGVDSPVTPPAAKVINSAANIAATGERDTDNNPFTPTIRDIILSPYGGPNVDPPGSGVLFSEVVTLFASDGTTAGSNSLVVYTDDGGVDRLSATPLPPGIVVHSANFATGTNGWVSAAIGPATMSSVGGLCISVLATGTSIGEWISPYAVFPTVDNAVYRVRLTMSTNQTTAGAVPLWDFYLQNLGTSPAAGDQTYIGDYFFLDNTGSANAVKGPATGLNTFDVWYAPSAFRTPQWRSATTGAYQPSLDSQNDARMIFRVLEADGAGYGSESDSGQLCLTNIEVTRFDYDNVIEGASVYSLNPIVSGINGVSVQDLVATFAPGTPGSGSNRDFSTNPLTITPADAAGWLVELTVITPGDTTNPTLGTPAYGNGAGIIDNYPIIWESNTLYQYTVMASAPNALAETNGPDSIRLGFDAKTIELFADSYILSGFPGRPGMPKQGAPQPYTMFLWSHNASLLTTPEAARLRWRLEVLNSDSYNRPTADIVRNQGGVRFHSVEVRKITFPAM